MAYRKISQCAALGFWLAAIAIVLLVEICLWFWFGSQRGSETQNDEQGAYETSEKTEVRPEKIDFQPIVDEWAGSVAGNRSVLVYDLENEKIVGEHNREEDYGTASLYKLFVVYETYRRLENSEWVVGDLVSSAGKTILECADLAIRESYSLCAEGLWAMIGHEELDEIIKTDYGITGSDISHLVSNSADILEMMKRFYNHPDISNRDLVAQMKDSFLNQPVTNYNWRQGLPSGFTRAKVYNKVGWEYNPNGGYWNIYHDAAIVEFPEENRHFVVVVMTNHVPFEQIREFGAKFENFYYSDVAHSNQ